MVGAWTCAGSVRIAIVAALAATSVPAAAQETDPPPPDLTGSVIQDIVVTASRRSTNIQRESRDVTAIDAEALTRKGVVDATSLSTLVPGLEVAQLGPQVQAFIRGVGDQTFTAANDPAVALNVDDFYYPKTFALSGQFFDLERVEVLKGPQGTLYGRNASAGVINLITAKPKFDSSGYIELEYGNYDSKRLTAAITGPVSDTLAIRFAGQRVDRDGYLSDGYNDDKSVATRTQLLWRPGPDTSALLSASYVYNDARGDAAVLVPRISSNPWAGPTDPDTLAVIAAVSPGNANQPKQDGYQYIRTYTVTGRIEHDFPWATLTILPSLIHSRLRNLSYSVPVIPIYTDTASRQKSIEIRLSSREESRVKWVIGALASDERVQDQVQSNQVTFISATFRPKLTDKTWAVFGEMNARLNDVSA
ncbi:TonB-dependent receptor-like protein [Sphingobium sp. SYK-6]|uniref:TonB-dependent receptor n=1 Tax=Sphingobium sp. (strain NBRC 103272 / SYK-6) TaxID=627192 RepID=UPI0002277346|nr:TonB-dependent receptor plug domain-containing protein [Sphingobium sp. SYK-6]BAK66520.1 TonB-dependent receptor-like protein [Sphingobium sp. SYK-6]